MLIVPSIFFKKNFFKNNTKRPINAIFYNNYYPFFLEKGYTFKKLFKKAKIRKAIGISFFTYNFITVFLENILSKRIFLKFDTNHSFKLPKKHIINTLRQKNKYFRTVKNVDFVLNEFYEILLYSLFLKESKLFIDYLLLVYETIPERIQRKFTLAIQNMFLQNINMFCSIFKIKGIYFDYKGKIGAINNAKKKRIFFTYGKIKSTTKKMRIDHQYRTVETLGGTLGLTFIIAF